MNPIRPMKLMFLPARLASMPFVFETKRVGEKERACLHGFDCNVADADNNGEQQTLDGCTFPIFLTLIFGLLHCVYPVGVLLQELVILRKLLVLHRQQHTKVSLTSDSR